MIKLVGGSIPVGYKLIQKITKIYQTHHIDPTPLITWIVTGLQKSTIKTNWCVTLLGQIFQDVPLIQPQLKDVLDLLIKSITKADSFKAVSYESLAKVIRSGHAMQQSDIILKALLKNPEKELQTEWADCIAAIVNDYPCNFIQWGVEWPQLQIAAIKELESGRSCKIMFQLMKVRLAESKLQGNMTTSFKEFNQTQKQDNSKKKTQVQIEAPRTMQDILNYFCQIMTKIQSAQEISPVQQKVCNGLGEVLCDLFKDHPEHLETIPSEILINSLLSTVAKPAQKAVILKVLLKAAESLQNTDYTINMISHLFECIKAKKLTSKSRQVQAPAQKINIAVSTTLIQVLNYLFQKQTDNRVTQLLEKNGENCNSFIDIMLPWLAINETSLHACETIMTLGLTSPLWLHQLISLMISCVQISSADFISNNQSFIYTGPKTQLQSVETLNRQTEALACLLKQTRLVIGGEPVALVNASLQSASNFIVGRHPISKYQTLSLDQFNLSNAGRREHGWTIIEGLLYQGQDWIEKHLSDLLNLFETAFSKQMCLVDQDRLIKDQIYQELYVQEFKLKARALRALRVMLSTQLSRKSIQTCGKFLASVTDYLLPKDSKQISLLVNQIELAQARTNLFECMASIPCQFYQSKLVIILHNICELLVNTNVSVPKGLLDTQDDSLYQFSEDENQDVQDTQKFTYILSHNSSNQQVEPSQQLVSVATDLFQKVFKSQILTQTNKDQLISHFCAHTAPSVKKTKQPNGEVTVAILPYRPEKIRKMQRVSTAVLLAMRGCENVSQYSKQLTEICANLMKICEPTLVRICCEIQIELQAIELIHKGPSQLLDIIEESLTKNLRQNLHQELMFAAAICGHIVRHFDERIGTPIDRISNIFLQLSRSPNDDVIRFHTHFAHQISFEYADFRSQILPAVFAQYYGQNQFSDQETSKQLTCFLSISTAEKTQYSEIIMDDHSSEVSVLRALSKQGIVKDQLFEKLEDLELVKTLVQNEKIEQLQAKCKGNFLHHVIDQIQSSSKRWNLDCEQSIQWKQLYRQVLSGLIESGGIKEHIEFVKHSCFQNVYLSPLTLLEQPGSSNIFKAPLQASTLAFFLDEIAIQITEQKQHHRLVIEVMQLALAAVTHQFKLVKLAGFGLLKCSIKQLSFVVEHVGDVDEDMSPRTRERQNYLQNPLLLEQFEAQIFSVIRQCLQSQGIDLQHEIVQACLDLIYDFITLPITRDQSLIKKILAMLVTKEMEKGTHLFQVEIFSHEGLIAQTHFLKLQLLAKLFLRANAIELNQSIKPDLPSKFLTEEQENLKSSFDKKTSIVLLQHWKAAISDTLLFDQTGQKNFTFLQGGTYNQDVIESTLPYLVEALRVIAATDIDTLVKDCIFRGLVAPFKDNLYAFYQQKIVYLQIAQNFIPQFCSESSFSELAIVLANLTQLGLSEINFEVLKIYILVQEKLLLAPQIHFNVDQVIHHTLSMLMQAEPEFTGQLQLQSQAANPLLINNCLLSLISSAKLVCANDAGSSLTNLMLQVVSRLCQFLSKSASPKYLTCLSTILQTIQKVTDRQQISTIATTLISELVVSSQKNSLSQVIVQLIQLLDQKDVDIVANIISDADNSLIEALIKVINSQKNLDLPNTIIKQLAIQAFTKCFQNVSDAQEALIFLLSFYQSQETQLKVKLLTPYCALLFQVIQCKIEGAPRQLAVEHLVELFKIDTVAIREFALSKDANGQPMLSGAEKTLAENVIRNYQAQQAAQSQTTNISSTQQQKKQESEASFGQVKKKIELKLKPKTQN